MTPTTISGPSRTLGLCLLLGAGACAIATDESVCRDVDLEPEICEAISAAAAGGKADDFPALRGILVERRGNRTFFKIPVAYTWEKDGQRLFDETVHKFTTEMARLNQELIDHGVDLTGILPDDIREAFSRNYLDTLDRIYDAEIESEMEILLGESYAEPRKLWGWQRYLKPQAFIGYIGGSFSVNYGVGGSLDATVMVVVQPWLALEIDHTAAEPTVVDKSYEVDAAVLAVPGFAIGVGGGGGAPLSIGAGAVFGPLDSPSDMAGIGIGAAGSFSLPFAGGGKAKVLSVLKYPPLFAGFLGYESGTAVKAGVYGVADFILDLPAFMALIKAVWPSF